MIKDVSLEEINRAMELAWNAFHLYRNTSLKQRADFMRAIAREIEALGDELLQVTGRETNLPEARLAREAELPYATLALATDYDCWNDDHDAVTVEQVIATLQANVAKAKQVVAAVAAQPPVGPDPAEAALRFAIMTTPAVVPAEARERLDLFLAKYWPR